MMSAAKKYRRILLKISGEAFMGDRGDAFDFAKLKHIARQVHDVSKSGIEIVIVTGAGVL
jgi:uridylate kinase